MRAATRAAAVVAMLAAGALSGCGGDEPATSATAGAGASGGAGGARGEGVAGRTGGGGEGAATSPAPATTAERTTGADAADPPRPDPAPPAAWTASCPTPTPSPVYGCRAVRGRVIGIESLDPDGDGDLHVIVREQLAEGGVTLPGISVLDVRASLRPKRDPRAGELVTGAGPVFRGSFRQKQVQVDVFRIWRP